MPDPVKILIQYPAPDKNGIVGETLWAIPMGCGIFMLDNEPCTDGYQYGDMVRCEPTHPYPTVRG
jgi:hypothetical protein